MLKTSEGVKVWIENRLRVLLIVAPLAFGMILGGGLVSLYGRLWGGVPAKLPHDYVTAGMALSSLVVVITLALFSVRVWRGADSRFPILWKIAPFSAGAGLILGTTVAGLKAAGKIV